MRYVIVKHQKPDDLAPTFTVQVEGSHENLSHHETEAEARAAREKYKAADRRRKRQRHEDTRNANHVDGYDRDDLGESPDY